MSPKLSPGPGQGLLSRCGGRVAGRSSAACAAVTGRRQGFVLHGSQIAPNTSGLPAWLYAQLTSADEPLLSVANTVAACVFGKRPGLWVSRFLREAVPVIRLSLAEGACGVWRWRWPGFVRGAPARASRGTVALPGAGST